MHATGLTQIGDLGKGCDPAAIFEELEIQTSINCATETRGNA
jgi:hypothetical protein